MRPVIELFDRYLDDPRAACIIGSGPSLKGFDFKKLTDPRLWTLAINQELERCFLDYWPNGWIYSDAWFSDDYCEMRLPGITVFETEWPHLGSLNPNRTWKDQSYFFQQDRCGTQPDWTYPSDKFISWGTTANTAIELCLKLGFRKIILLGIDLNNDDGEYYSDQHATGARIKHNFDKMLEGMKKLWHEVYKHVPEAKILCCSLNSRAPFARCTFDQAMKEFFGES